jgi:O-glycosyl hydrolase
MLWALGNYARFIRPGMLRIGLDRSDNSSVAASLDGLMATAFMDPETQKTVIVAINYGSSAQSINLQTDRKSTFKYYRTSASEDLRFVDQIKSSKVHQLPPRSITTFVEQ